MTASLALVASAAQLPRSSSLPHVKPSLRPSASEIQVRNELLQALPPEPLARLAPFLQRIPLKRKQVLHERNVPILSAYFIECGTASLLFRSPSSREAMEVAAFGPADVVGVPAILGSVRSPHRCVVQVAGEALRIQAEHLQFAMQEMPLLRQLLLSYVYAVILQSTQLAVCSARHSVWQRLARCLLSSQDRLRSYQIPLTHDAISRALGVRRAGVTMTMGEMELAGLIRRGRGCVSVIDRARLEQEACECYAIIRAEHRRILLRARPTAPAAGAQAPPNHEQRLCA